MAAVDEDFAFSDEDVSDFDGDESGSDFGGDSPVAAKPAKTKASRAAPRSKASALKPVAANSSSAGSKSKAASKGKGKGGKKTIEQIYQKKTQLEHILLRPDTYVGSMQKNAQSMWVWDVTCGRIVQREVTYVPGLYKIFDELLVNAADNKQRDDSMKAIRVTIDREAGEISVWNDGRGIPCVMHSEHGVYVPELIFGHLLTSSNYDDGEKKVTGGRNGYGAKLANIFSSRFVVETCDNETGLVYRQEFSNNMNTKGEPELRKARSSDRDFTCITFRPDLERFGMESLDEDIVALFTKRVYDMAGITPKSVSVYLNDLKLPVKDFAAYVSLYRTEADKEAEAAAGVNQAPPEAAAAAAASSSSSSSRARGGFDADSDGYSDMSEDEDDEEYGGGRKGKKAASSSAALPTTVLPRLFCQVSKRWEVAVTVSDGSFSQVSFVNAICTTRGGNHVKLVADQIAEAVCKSAARKNKGVPLKAHHVKNHMTVFVNALIENPAFDSQTKDTLITTAKNFGSECILPDKFVKDVVSKSGVVDRVLSWAKFKQNAELKRKGGSKTRTLTGIPKLDDANNAGTAKADRCTLILTEGDSAKALAISGLAVVGRDNYGVFPLKGKLLNVREASHKQIMANAEIQNLVKIMGLQFGKTYDSASGLRYGHLMIMADQDHDGSHIKGLIINFLHHFWPSLLEVEGFLQQFITPIVKVTRGSKATSFFTLPEYKSWREANNGGKGWAVRYYKGLGTSSAKEAKEYFADLDTHVIDFEYDAEADRRAGEASDDEEDDEAEAEAYAADDGDGSAGSPASGGHGSSSSSVSAAGGGDEFSLPDEFDLDDLDDLVDGAGASSSSAAGKNNGKGKSKAKKAAKKPRKAAVCKAKFARTDPDLVDLAFSKKRADDRKMWLQRWKPGTFVDYAVERMPVGTFIDRELILFSRADNERSIPSFTDGLKPSQRKVLFACFKRNLKKDIKVAQLAGYVSEHSAYHHGEASLAATIVGMAQDFVGSNNINLLVPSGQFGTRIMGGRDAASPRYVFTRLHNLARLLFPQDDDALLKYLNDDGQRIEPEFYYPVIPLALVNGADGIGTGWSSYVPAYNPRDIIESVRATLRGEEAMELSPWFRGFEGEVVRAKEGKQFVFKGAFDVSADGATLTVRELPIRKWTQDYKVFLESLTPQAEKEKEKAAGKGKGKGKGTAAAKKKAAAAAAAKRKKKAAAKDGDFGDDDASDADSVVSTASVKATPSALVKEFRENHTDTTVAFTITLTAEGKRVVACGEAAIRKAFKLDSAVATTNMHLFDEAGRIRRFSDPRTVMQRFVPMRLAVYEQRRAHMLARLRAELGLLASKQRFIEAVLDGSLVVSRRSKAAIVEDLLAMGLRPRKTAGKGGKSTGSSKAGGAANDDDDDDEEETTAAEEAGAAQVGGFDSDEIDPDTADAATISKGFNYLLGMSLLSLTAEKVVELRAEREEKEDEVERIEATTAGDLWETDLEALEEGLDADDAARAVLVEAEEKARRKAQGIKGKKGKGGGRAAASAAAGAAKRRLQAARALKAAKAASSRGGNDWDDEDEDEADDGWDSESDGSDFEGAPVASSSTTARRPARTRAPRRKAAPAASYDEDSDEDHDAGRTVPSRAAGAARGRRGKGQSAAAAAAAAAASLATLATQEDVVLEEAGSADDEFAELDLSDSDDDDGGVSSLAARVAQRMAVTPPEKQSKAQRKANAKTKRAAVGAAKGKRAASDERAAASAVETLKADSDSESDFGSPPSSPPAAAVSGSSALSRRAGAMNEMGSPLQASPAAKRGRKRPAAKPTKKKTAAKTVTTTATTTTKKKKQQQQQKKKTTTTKAAARGKKKQSQDEWEMSDEEEEEDVSASPVKPVARPSRRRAAAKTAAPSYADSDSEAESDFSVADDDDDDEFAFDE